MGESKTRGGNILGTAPIGSLLLKFSVPGIISMVVNALYNIVDQVFIGRGVGYLGNGATNVIFPLVTFASALALLLGDGTASYVSLMLGQRKNKDAAKGFAAGVMSTIVAGILLMAAYLIFLTPLSRLFGATDAILPYALSYGRIIAIGMPFLCICAGISSIIRADGSPRFNMAGLLLGCALNVILDPIFIFIFHWGVAGAAFATIIGQIANALLNLFYVIKMVKSVDVSIATYKECLGHIPKVMRLGVSSFINQAAVVMLMLVQNNLLVTYGAQSVYGPEIPLTSLGVTMKVFNILLSVIIGLTGGAQPILGFNYGDRQYDRVKKTLRAEMIISIIIFTIAFILFQTVPMTIVSIFGTDSELYMEFSVKCLKIFLLFLPIACVQMVASTFFQAVGHPIQASILSLSKQIIIQIPAMLILCPLIGVDGALWSGPCADGVACVLSIVLLKFYWNRIFNTDEVAAVMPHALNTNLWNYSIQAAQNELSKQPVIITVGRSYGAGGRPVGKGLAERLGIPYYDSEILTRTAEKLGMDPKFVESADEKSASALNMIQAVPSMSNPNLEVENMRQRIALTTREVIEELASEGSCVMIGRAADQILKDKFNVLSVYITMPYEKRVKLVMERENLSEKDARRMINQIDHERAANYNDMAETRWDASESYDISLDLYKLGTDGAVDMIETVVRKRGLI